MEKIDQYKELQTLFGNMLCYFFLSEEHGFASNSDLINWLQRRCCSSFRMGSNGRGF